MLFVFFGTDGTLTRKKSDQLVQGLLKKRPDAALSSFTDEDFHPGVLEESIFGQALFGGSYIIELTNILSVDEYAEAILPRLAEIAASTNVIILREHALSKEFERKLKLHAHTMAEQVLPTQKPKERFNTFALGDALYAGNRKELWVLLSKARLSGIADEEILGSLWYSVKALYAANIEGDASSAGLKPYPYQKAKAVGRKFGSEERERLLDSLMQVQIDMRRGEGDLSNLLERWVLGV